MNKLVNSALAYGFIIAIVLISLSAGLSISELAIDSKLTMLSYPIFIIGLSIGLINFKKLNEGYITFGSAFKYSMIFSMTVLILTVIFGYINMEYLNPDIIEKTMELQRIKLEEANMDDEMIEQSIAMSKKFLTPTTSALVGFFLGGAVYTVISLIMAAILKKNRPMEF